MTTNIIMDLFKEIIAEVADQELENRSLLNVAVDMEDHEKSQQVLIDTLSKIHRFRKWRAELDAIRVDMDNSGLLAGDGQDQSGELYTGQGKYGQDAAGLANYPDDISIVDHVLGKLRELAQSGFEFTLKEINELTDENWSKAAFDINVAFAKVALGNVDISKDGKIYYWKEIFTFGASRLLLCNEWSAANIKLFEIWLDGIVSLRRAPQWQR